MTAKHFLTPRAIVLDRKLAELSDCDYDEFDGAWKWSGRSEFLVKSSHPKRPHMSTKKEDVETAGEDVKGL